MKNKQLKIIYRNYGIADRFPDGTIELNKNLDKFPALKASIIEHEVRHTDNPKFNKKDFLHDLTTRHQYSQMQMIKFMFLNPRSFAQFLPIYKSKSRGWIMDKNL